ncbi:UDP-N-acetylmuramyl pentapeptide phosphotransferase/UDP-N-acetylglucosamine-1-phosphate transferase [Rhodovulum adriaticum]|uniref:UDP-N-acetylmuramyl pentapeptide phosphotransferase/UDP-N-acetylglucosamine-1-phosphate transferase n=2 Tax=Rhodovulum adriaticum TaxID=35804 RepID=A0A4R2NYN2_RHOAD|nr:UDP-N-acetylmuramyl pentapeptide phosphotransferase/UDP-N-acetylglucosamine-1-phosphate transferase [Rhodovulum adriaticum]
MQLQQGGRIFGALIQPLALLRPSYFAVISLWESATLMPITGFFRFDPQLLHLSPEVWALLLISALATVIVALAVVANRRPLSRLMRERDDAQAVQSSHTGNPLRLGGVAIFAGLGAGILIGDWEDATLPALLLMSALPALLAGLWEDLGHRVSPFRRLLASFVAGAVAVAALGSWVMRADLPGLDGLMAFAPLAILLTVFVSAGFCHATNLVDGMNGLAGVIIISASIALALLAQGAGQGDLALMAALLGAAMVGFFLLNWPFGTIFMGDAGSYGVGHTLIWIAFLLAAREPDIAVPALLLILFWPFADTLHSIARRLSSRAPVFAPDRMHLHQKMRRFIEIVWLGGAHRQRSNPMATLALAPMIVMPVIAGVLLSHDARAAWIALAVFGGLFAVTNVAITRMAVRRRRKFRQETETVAQTSECSPLSHTYTGYGRTMLVRIYRKTGEKDWRLAIIDRDNAPVEWANTFATDAAAAAEFQATVENGMIGGLLTDNPPPRKDAQPISADR